ncbi:MAG: hypothetical protein J3R72DRAFT_180684 [Linnemannia gamsii]|nr:MAG: hypothetical protein J3R72DRAFT_180684 [Linnemannia gamsii]
MTTLYFSPGMRAATERTSKWMSQGKSVRGAVVGLDRKSSGSHYLFFGRARRISSSSFSSRFLSSSSSFFFFFFFLLLLHHTTDAHSHHHQQQQHPSHSQHSPCHRTHPNQSPSTCLQPPSNNSSSLCPGQHYTADSNRPYTMNLLNKDDALSLARVCFCWEGFCVCVSFLQWTDRGTGRLVLFDKNEPGNFFVRNKE